MGLQGSALPSPELLDQPPVTVPEIGNPMPRQSFPTGRKRRQPRSTTLKQIMLCIAGLVAIMKPSLLRFLELGFSTAFQ